MNLTKQELRQVDEIMLKPKNEWTDEEFELVIEWRVQSALDSEMYEVQYNAIQEELIEAAEIHHDSYMAAQDTLNELKSKALELFERASL